MEGDKSKAAELLKEIAETIRVELDKRRDLIQRFLASLEVDEETYKQLMVREIINSVDVDAMFAFPPWKNHTPEKVKAKALSIFHKKLERDKRLFLKHDQPA